MVAGDKYVREGPSNRKLSLDHMRKKYISRHYYERPNAIKFKNLLSITERTHLIPLAKFIKAILYIFRPDIH